MKHKANDGLALEAGKMAVIFLSASVLANAQMMAGGAGPSVLSRGGNAAGMRGSEAADLTFYAGASGHYDSGIYTPATDGSLEATSSPGYGLSWGAYGLHSWGRRTTLGIDYRGDYLHLPEPAL